MYNLIKSYYIKINRFRKKTILRIKSMNVKPNEKPIIILGNQKSGTTAIAALLGLYLEKNVTLDMLPLWYEIDKIITEKRKFSDFVDSYSVLFLNHVIKEPWLTFIPMQIFSKFPESKFILIIRDSRDNIRSILDKINIPGNKETNPNMLKRLKPGWKQIFEPELFHWDCKHYIDVLCYRWNYAASISDKYKSQNIIIVKYEDFNKDKIVFIKNLVNHLEEKGHGDIYQFINVPFQPRGENKHISWQEFYGEKNLHRIESLCRDIMKNYGYKKSLVGPK